MITKTKYKGKVREYAKVVQSYWDGKTSRPRVLLNLGRIKSEEDRQKFKRILERMKVDRQFVDIRDITAKSTKEFGVTYTTNVLLEKYGISTVLDKYLSMNKAEFGVYEVVRALITNRLVEPSSDLAAHDWIVKHYPEELDVKEHHIYRALDHLIKYKEEIESELFRVLKKRLKLDTSRTYYDLTSSYFEGTKCTLAMYGYSRDRKKGKKQIVLGLAMCDGIPVMHEVFKGNTQDKVTLQGMQKNLRERLGIKKTIVVADRGLMTDENVKALEESGYEYILGLNRRNNKIAEKHLIKMIRSPQRQSARERHREVVELHNGEKIVRRYIVCKDKETRKARLKTLKQIRKNLTKKLTELQQQYAASQKRKKGRKMTKNSLMRQAFKALGKNKRLFDVEFDKGLTFSFNEENWEYEKKIAGKFILQTTTDLEPVEVVKSYKELLTVESAFDEIKNFLDLRPINHTKEPRVKAHVFVCVLSFLIQRIIERYTSQTARKVIKELLTVRIVLLDIKRKQMKLITELSPEVKRIYKELGVQRPVQVPL